MKYKEFSNREIIGQGGFAIVHKCVWEKTNNLVAIKTKINILEFINE
ncbi:6859_t:CDS:1, partial [Racocetra persica]